MVPMAAVVAGADPGDGAEEGAGARAHVRETAGKASHEELGQGHEALGNFRLCHDVAGEEEERNGHIGEGVNAVVEFLRQDEEGHVRANEQGADGGDAQGNGDGDAHDEEKEEDAEEEASHCRHSCPCCPCGGRGFHARGVPV